MDVGKPADVILKVGAEWKADMIVIASHGRGGMRRLVLGSVAEAVMRRSDCPVLVVRAKE
jgi:nucleotide-binding universal stress UspA family protein